MVLKHKIKDKRLINSYYKHLNKYQLLQITNIQYICALTRLFVLIAYNFHFIQKGIGNGISWPLYPFTMHEWLEQATPIHLDDLTSKARPSAALLHSSPLQAANNRQGRFAELPGSAGNVKYGT